MPNARKPSSSSDAQYYGLGFYQLLNPNGPRVFGYHACTAALVAFLSAVQCVTAFGVLGFFADAHSSSSTWSLQLEVAVILTNCTLSSLKMYTLVANADAVRELFRATRTGFLRRATRDPLIAAALEKRCARAAAVTRWIARSFLAGLLLWAAGPFVAPPPAVPPPHRPNIINIRFPVAARVYDRYYYAFYAMELAVGSCIVYGSVLVDAFLMSFCWMVAAQYQSVAAAYEQFAHHSDASPDGAGGHCDPQQQQRVRVFDDRSCPGTTTPTMEKDKKETYNDFISIIIDHQNVYLKMKSFYDIVRPITLIHVFAYSCSLIMYAYVIVTMFHSQDPLIVSELLKIITTVSNVMLEVYIYCYLFELVDAEKEAVNFGLYSCNWTEMDIEFKKLLLMSMKMNNANRLKLKATANITIDRPFFANVIHTCFKIVSVLTQTQSNDLVN